MHELNGTLVGLRPIRNEDLPAIRHWRSNPDVTRYWISRKIPSLEELQQWLHEKSLSDSVTLMVLDPDGEPVGYVDLFKVDCQHRRAELSIMIGDRAAQGRGYGRDALVTMLRHVFAKASEGGMGLHKVSLSVFASNTGALRLYQSCGFREDGVLREDMWCDGEWHDQLLMSILEHEFRDLNSQRKSE